MLLSLSPNFHDVELMAKHYGLNLEKELIIDISALLKVHRSNFFSVCELQNFDQINEESVRSYIKELGKLSILKDESNKGIRDIKIANFNVFWLTNLAVKHPAISLGKNVHLLARVLPFVRSRMTGKIFVCMPDGTRHFQNITQGILNENGFSDIYFLKRKQPVIIPFLNASIRLLIFYCKCLYLFFNKKNKQADTSYNNYFITVPNCPVDEKYHDFFLSYSKNITDSISPSAYWPVFYSFSFLKRSRIISSLPYTNALPSIKQLFKILYDGLKCTLYFNWKTAKKDRSFFDNHELLNYEIKSSVYRNLHTIFYTQWIQNYFSKISLKTNVIYQDEFYEGGRLISQALNYFKNITTIGMQHGLFDLHHTVYGISEMEFSENTGKPLPTPDFFVVWGDYFKRYFLSNNNWSANKIKVLGYPKYMDMDNSLQMRPQKIKKILWCTDTPALTVSDQELIESLILNNAEFEVTVRMHPLYNYLKEYENDLKLFQQFPTLKLSDNYSIIDDIASHDLIIVNCYTTAFLDTYLSGKYCMRLFPYADSPAYIKYFNSPIIFNIFCEEDILMAFQKMENSVAMFSLKDEAKELMNIDIKGWEQLIKSPLTESMYLTA